jgi:hypothetical protein
MSVTEDEIQNVVRQTVWPWDATSKAVSGGSGGLRTKALTQALIMLAVAALFYYVGHHRVLPRVLGVLAVVNVALGLAAPRAFAALDRALQVFGRWVGQGLSWLLLAPFFYLFFVPARLILAARGKDPMNRRFPDTPASYWTPRRPVKGPDDYRKQF